MSVIKGGWTPSTSSDGILCAKFDSASGRRAKPAPAPDRHVRSVLRRQQPFFVFLSAHRNWRLPAPLRQARPYLLLACLLLRPEASPKEYGCLDWPPT